MPLSKPLIPRSFLGHAAGVRDSTAVMGLAGGNGTPLRAPPPSAAPGTPGAQRDHRRRPTFLSADAHTGSEPPLVAIGATAARGTASQLPDCDALLHGDHQGPGQTVPMTLRVPVATVQFWVVTGRWAGWTTVNDRCPFRSDLFRMTVDRARACRTPQSCRSPRPAACVPDQSAPRNPGRPSGRRRHGPRR
jgi:hypothetical protein